MAHRRDAQALKHATARRRRQASRSPPDKNPAAVALGRLGGLKGGNARAASLSKKDRSEIARKAAAAR